MKKQWNTSGMVAFWKLTEHEPEYIQAIEIKTITIQPNTIPLIGTCRIIGYLPRAIRLLSLPKTFSVEISDLSTGGRRDIYHSEDIVIRLVNCEVLSIEMPNPVIFDDQFTTVEVIIRFNLVFRNPDHEEL